MKKLILQAIDSLGFFTLFIALPYFLILITD